MSGHSHAKTVKRVKDANDAKRSRIFSKMAKIISIAAKDGGDPEANVSLKQAIEQAKKFNMPKNNITRAIKRGTGEEEGEQLEEVSYEAIGPGGVSLILEGITDNKNRTLAEIRQLLQKHNSKLADEGSQKWAFGQKGVITVKIEHTSRTDNQENVELIAIESGAEDMHLRKYEDEEYMEIITAPEKLETVKQKITEQGIKIEATSLDWVANEKIEVNTKEREACEKLFDELEDHEVVQSIYSNLKPL